MTRLLLVLLLAGSAVGCVEEQRDFIVRDERGRRWACHQECAITGEHIEKKHQTAECALIDRAEPAP